MREISGERSSGEGKATKRDLARKPPKKSVEKKLRWVCNELDSILASLRQTAIKPQADRAERVVKQIRKLLGQTSDAKDA
jgi:hypothetical protein